MSLKLQIIILVAGLIILIFLVNQLKLKKINFKYGLGWMFVTLCIMVLAAYPKTLLIISKFFGIASPTNMLFFFGECLSVVLIFSLSKHVSQLSDKVRKLSQELAILRKDSYDQINELKDDEKDKKAE